MWLTSLSINIFLDVIVSFKADVKQWIKILFFTNKCVTNKKKTVLMFQLGELSYKKLYKDAVLSQLQKFHLHHHILIGFHQINLISDKFNTCTTRTYSLCGFLYPTLCWKKDALMELHRSILVACIDIKFLILMSFARKSLHQTSGQAVFKLSLTFLTLNIFVFFTHNILFGFNFFVLYIISINFLNTISSKSLFAIVFKFMIFLVTYLPNLNRYEVYQLLLVLIHFHLLRLHVI